MTTTSHGPLTAAPERGRWLTQLLVPEMWASLTIIVIWLAVLVDAIVGPDIVTAETGGGTSTIPSAVAVALFAFLSTWVVARHAFRHDRRD
jgi:hypothetical protein